VDIYLNVPLTLPVGPTPPFDQFEMLNGYGSGGYYSGFKQFMAPGGGGCENLGFPIGELLADGSCMITKEQNGTGGEVGLRHKNADKETANIASGFRWHRRVPTAVRDSRCELLRI
jgi:hypothetical protein